jgi:phospholipid/cholesterol/gamma-HCH transport system substrate-binding protein
MNKNLSSGMLATIGAIALAFTMAVSVILIRYGEGYFVPTYELTAVFPTSTQGLFTDGGTDVKMRGVNIGTVTRVELLDDGRARLSFAIDEGVEIPATVAARIEPLSVFGPKFVSFIPESGPTRGELLADGDEIAGATVRNELTGVLADTTSLLDRIDTQDVIEIFDAVSTGLNGRGDEVGETIDGAKTLVDIADRRRPELTRFLPDLDRLSSSIASRSSTFLDRVGTYQTVADLVAGRDADVAGILDAAATIALRSSTLLDDAAAEFDLTVRAMADVMAGIYSERELVPSSLDAVGAFFDMLGAGMRLPGPDGKKLTALKGFITVDLCLVYGICLLPDGGIERPEQQIPPPPTRPGDPIVPGLPLPPVPDGGGLLDIIGGLLEPIGGGR